MAKRSKKVAVKKNNKAEDYDNSDSNTIYYNSGQFTGVMRKYWKQRKQLFKKYDNGIILTKELWFSVTPESMSKFTAKFLNNLLLNEQKKKLKILDAFCGGGSNIIQFLKYEHTVYCADINKIHLKCTLNNAKIYLSYEDIKDTIKLVPINWKYSDQDLDDGFIDYEFEEKEVEEAEKEDIYASKSDSLNSIEELKQVKFDVVFGSPPWGGPGYMKSETFDLQKDIQPYGLEKMLGVFNEYSDNICLFLPKNTAIADIRKCTRRVFGKNYPFLRVVKVNTGGFVKGFLVCWGKGLSGT